VTGSVHDHDALRELYETLLDHDAPPLVLVERLTAMATRCGWTGESDVITWSARRVAIYRQAITEEPHGPGLRLVFG
jgi:hypothetical protein